MDALLVERFWTHVEKTDTCWLWSAGKSKAGYGQIRYGSRPGKIYYAHRISAELAYGNIDGYEIHHICCVKACVRPSHLQVVLGTEHPDNPAVINRGKAFCIRGHELVGKNLVPDKTGRRVCRQCTNEKRRRFYEPRIRVKKSHCIRGHAFTSDNTYVKPNGAYECKECNRLRAQRYVSRNPDNAV